MLHWVTSTDAFRIWMTTDFQPSQTNCCVFHIKLLWLDPHSLVIVMDHCDHSQITFHRPGHAISSFSIKPYGLRSCLLD